MSGMVDIIIPTFDNVQYIVPCINSILMHTVQRENMNIIIVNNGHKDLENYITKHPLVSIYHTGKNLGWEGGLKFGMERSKAEFVCFMNDDTYVPYSSYLWLSRCLSEFKNKNVAAVGPTSNIVRGFQNIFLDQFAGCPNPFAPFLIFYCVFIRKSHLEEVGGIDDTLPGGDDFDLSIRFGKAGKKMVICRDAFVFHHGFKTGERVRGSPNKPGGWNSREMTDKTNMGLIGKHGFKSWVNCNFGSLENRDNGIRPDRKVETDIVREYVKDGKVYDLGCGSTKTVENSIGIDRIRMGDAIPNLGGEKSVADLYGDVSQELPFPDNTADTIIARHILEHCIDPVDTLKMWARKITDDGRIVLVLPDERISSTIPLDPEHKHAFTPKSLESIATLLGLKQVVLRDNYNGISFTSVLEKNGSAHS